MEDLSRAAQRGTIILNQEGIRQRCKSLVYQKPTVGHCHIIFARSISEQKHHLITFACSASCATFLLAHNHSFHCYVAEAISANSLHSFMPQGNRYAFPSLPCNAIAKRKMANFILKTRYIKSLSLISVFIAHSISSHHILLCSSTDVRLPLTITQTIPSSPSPPKAPSTTIPRLRP